MGYNEPRIQIAGDISHTTSLEYLGLILDENLSRTHYIKDLGNQGSRNEIHIGGAERRSEQKWGSGALPPGKFFMTTPFRSLENAPLFENVLLTEAKDHD